MGRDRKEIKQIFREALKDGLYDFRDKVRKASVAEQLWERVLRDPRCGLTGRLINWREDRSYEVDHIRPVANGGETSVDNLMLVCPEANRAKGTLSHEEFIQLCCDVARASSRMIDRPKLDQASA